MSSSSHVELQLILSRTLSLLYKDSFRRRASAGVPVSLAAMPWYPAAVDLEWAGNRIQNKNSANCSLQPRTMKSGTSYHLFERNRASTEAIILLKETKKDRKSVV